MKIVIVGAGITGCTAGRILTDRGHNVEIFEKENCIGGACADNEKMHLHGPHIFHTNNKEVWDFVNRFSEFVNYNHCVIANTDAGEIPIPYNYNSEKITGVISDDYIRKLIYENYSKRQWGISFSELPEEITERVKLRRDGTDNRYFQDTYQAQPVNGFSEMLRKMITGIPVHLNCKENEWKGTDYDSCVYTGSVNELLDYKYGHLKYRSLKFERVETYLQAAVINNCKSDNTLHTRETDYHYLTGFNITTREIPVDYDGTNQPYYPIPFGESLELSKKYFREIPDNIICLGRLGSYKYINMDTAIEKVMEALCRI